jgi:hypothetical protein
MSTDPAAARAYIQCPTCTGWVRSDHAIGMDGVCRCSLCGHRIYEKADDGPLVDSENRTPPASPIVGRKVFRSASLRDPGHPCPLLAAADAGEITCSHPL